MHCCLQSKETLTPFEKGGRAKMFPLFSFSISLGSHTKKEEEEKCCLLASAKKCRKMKGKECGKKCDRPHFCSHFISFFKGNIWFHILLLAAGDHCHTEIRSDTLQTLEMTFSSHQKLGLSQSILFLLFSVFPILNFWGDFLLCVETTIELSKSEMTDG